MIKEYPGEKAEREVDESVGKEDGVEFDEG